ncbi:MAG: gamma-glutamyltransferase [Prolixibacteraceae bacterium]|nr:gamma-glutamyltransferase [Prolixibacteraceae bacterium]
MFNHAVSDYGMFSIGGEVPFMFYNSTTGNVLVYNGMGGAPLDPEAIDWYYENGIPDRKPGGIKIASVPSAISTCLAALEQKGTMSFEQILSPTLELLDKGGKDWYDELAVTLRRMIETEQKTVGTREQKIRAARDRFYKGDIADELNEYYVKAGGFLRKADLEAHQTIVEEPVTIKYRGYTVHKCNTWTQGPVLLQSLRLLEKFDLKSMGFMSPDYVHTVVEAMKLAFADRDKYYGDPQFVQVPLKELLSDEYTSIRYPLIDPVKASKEIRPGDPYNMKALSDVIEYQSGDKGTTTCVVVDEWGNVVAATPSSNPVYGICESLGIAHNTRVNSLNTQKGHPNAIEPGKRPRITLTPTIVLKDGAPVLAFSVAGSDMQDQVTLQLLLDFIEFGKMPKDAITAPRFNTLHTEDSFNANPDPGERFFESAKLEINQIDQSVLNNLTGRGHAVSVVDKDIAYPVMVYIDQTTGISYAASQPRKTNSKYSGALKKR